jgi:hypothetical protein
MCLHVLHANGWTGYLICQLFPQAEVVPWRIDLTAGDVVDRLSRPAMTPAAGAALLFHIDLSDTRRTPRERQWLLQWLRTRQIAALNAGCDDLSRRRLQTRLRELALNSVAIGARPDPAERVIVKTDPNHGGESEMRLSYAQRATLGIAFEGAPFVAGRQYRVLPLRGVPPGVLAHPDYAVERFVENASGLFFRAYVSGTAVVVVKAYCTAEIKAISGDARDENWAFLLDELDHPTPAEIPVKVARTIRAFALAEDLHFGSIDVVQDEHGEPYVVDLNTTPWGGKAPVDAEIAAFLRDGFMQGIQRRHERARDVLSPRVDPPEPQGDIRDAQPCRHHCSA